MSSTSLNVAALIDAAVRDDDDQRLLWVLERAHRSGELGLKDILLEAVVLLQPPYADYARMHTILMDIWGTSVEEEAAIWDAYRYVTVQPEDSSFMQILARYESAESLYFRAQFHAYDGDSDAAIMCNAASIEKAAFPNNLKLRLRIEPELSRGNRARLIDQIEELIEISNSETVEAHTANELYDLYWKELILGTAMSTVVWHEFRREFAV